MVAGVHRVQGMFGDAGCKQSNMEAAKWMLAMSAACVLAAIAVSSIGGV